MAFLIILSSVDTMFLGEICAEMIRFTRGISDCARVELIITREWRENGGDLLQV